MHLERKVEWNRLQKRCFKFTCTSSRKAEHLPLFWFLLILSPAQRSVFFWVFFFSGVDSEMVPSNTGARAKCFSIISPMFCHVDSRLEQNGCSCSESKGSATQRKNDAWRWRKREGGWGVGERKHCCDAGTQSGASSSPPSNTGRKTWTELVYNNQNWKGLAQRGT